MRARLFAMLLLVAGCTDGTKGTSVDTVVPDDTDVDTTDTDGSDTDDGWDVETGWEDSATQDSTFQPMDSNDTPTESIAADTGVCPFGEKLDCDEFCFPAYFIGDGTCDDGATFQSNFNCVQYNFDGGDCRSDTGVIVVDTDEGCLFQVIMHVLTWSNEIGWQIRDENGRVVYEVFPGTYADNNRDYIHPVTLEPGNYTFVMIDSFGDGWHNGFFEVVNPANGDLLATGTIPVGSQGTRDFEVDCDFVPDDTDGPAVCGDVEVKIETQGWGGEISWDIVDRSSTLRGNGDGYLSYQTYTDRIALGEGYYHFRLYDAFGDGWADGTYTVTDLLTGDVLSTGTLVWGDYSSRAFVLSCSDTFNPDVDDSDVLDPPIGPEITCDTVVLAIETGDDGGDAGWVLTDDAGTVLDSRTAGQYQPNSTYYIVVPVGSGEYTLELTDTNGDGWDGGSAQIIDVDSGAVLGEVSPGQSTVTFEADCGGVVVTPDDTGPIPPDTGLCAPDATPDCQGICWPESFVGDGFCDDGTIYAPDFFCPEFGLDGGDCSTGS